MISSSASLSGVADLNSGGNIQLDSMLSSGISTDTGFGRITLGLQLTGTGTFGSTHTTVNLTGYRGAYTTPTGQQVEVIELIELDGNEVASGVAYPQSGSSGLSGDYALNLSGVSNVKSNPIKEDIVGQATAVSGAFSGTLNINNFGRTATSPNVPLTTGTTIVSPDANGRGTLTLDTNVSNDSSFSIVYYDSDNGVLLFDADGSRVAIGSMNPQF